MTPLSFPTTSRVAARMKMKESAARILGGGLLLLAAAALVWDIVTPEAPTGTPAANEGFSFGYFVGIGLRTLLLGGIGWRLLAGPSRGPGEHMRNILAANGPQVPAAKPENGDLYATASDDDLLAVYGHIDREANPERFAALLWEVSRRLSRRSTDAGPVR